MTPGCMIAFAVSGFTAAAQPDPVQAQNDTTTPPALHLGISYRGDVMGVSTGNGARDVTYLDNLDLIASLDLDRAFGWRGATVHADVLNNLGGRPNDTARTLQGVNNIEVGAPKALLYQAWVQQNFAADRLSVLAGRYDLNSEFYYNGAASQLIGPAFGIGSELASTGPNGPSIFPQTELAVRVRATQGNGYVQTAVIRAPRGTVNDGGRRTVLLIAEAGWRGRTALSAGAWTYTRAQPRIAPPGLTIAPGTAASRGAYVLAEQDVIGQSERPGHWRAFLRAGISDGRTTAFAGGLQIGVAGHGIVPLRPDSAASIGFGTAFLSTPYRRANPIGEAPLAGSEDVFELTYSDRLLTFLSLQPDVQYIRHPSGLRNADDVIVLGIRAIVDFKVQ